MHKVVWKDSVTDLICRLCGFEGKGRRVLTLKTNFGLSIAPVECPVCRSLDIVDEPIPFAESQEQVDIYVEFGAGIDTIASLISCVDESTVSSFVDIGCGFGFSLFLAEGLYGWRSYGYEPSPLAEAGSRALGVDIRHEPFTRESVFSDAPDFVFSSEVIEHIPNPLEFLSTIQSQLPVGAILVMTTPNRSVVTPDSPPAELSGALSPGFHVLVASADGMRRLVERAGFAFCEVREQAERLIVAVSNTSGALDRFALRDVSRREMDAWYERTIPVTEPGSALRVGLTNRLLDSLVAQGDFTRARPVAHALRVDLETRFGGFDVVQLLAKSKPKLNNALFPLMSSVSYNLGMIALLGDDDPRAAAGHFAHAISAGTAWFDAGGAQFLALVNMVAQARVTRLLALARFAPADAQRLALTGDGTLSSSGYLVARTLVEAVASGNESAVGKLVSAAQKSAPDLALSEHKADRVAAQDALFMIAGVSERRGDIDRAVEFYRACVASCEGEPLQSSHEIDLMRQSHDALRRCGVSNLTEPHILTVVTHASPLPVVHFAPEVFWRDASGIFLEGWIHAGGIPVSSVDVHHGNASVRAENRHRSDLTNIFAALGKESRPNFRAYVPHGRGEHIDVVATTSEGTLAVRWEMPFHNLPAVPDGDVDLSRFEEAIAREIAGLPDGPVLVVGARTDQATGEAPWEGLFGNRKVVSLDIHPGHGVDVEGDVHNLEGLFGEGTFQAVYTESVLEHLALPWVAASQMLRVLAPGGVSAHAVPWVFPGHAEPNDFFRISREGLKALFSAEMGCETLLTGSARVVSVVPAENWRTADSPNMPALASDSMSWIISRKVSSPSGEVAWPKDDLNTSVRAEQYPVTGNRRVWGDES